VEARAKVRERWKRERGSGKKGVGKRKTRRIKEEGGENSRATLRNSASLPAPARANVALPRRRACEHAIVQPLLLVCWNLTFPRQTASDPPSPECICPLPMLHGSRIPLIRDPCSWPPCVRVGTEAHWDVRGESGASVEEPAPLTVASFHCPGRRRTRNVAAVQIWGLYPSTW
jgi:hypothetical protein